MLGASALTPAPPTCACWLTTTPFPPPSLQPLVRTAKTLLSRWPADPLRPTAHLGTILSTRLSQTPPLFPGEAGPSTSSASTSPSPSPSASPTEQEDQVRAVAALLDDAFLRRYAFRPERSASGGLLTPRGNPGYYERLIDDLKAVPTRTWLDRVRIRLGGLLRVS